MEIATAPPPIASRRIVFRPFAEPFGNRQLFDLPLDKLLDPLEFILFLFADERDPGTAVRPIRWM